MCIPNRTSPKPNIQSISPVADGSALFSFRDFKLKSITIENKFNNHYKDINELNEKIIRFLTFSLPWFSNETIEALDKNLNMKDKFHFHKVGNDRFAIIEEILYAYEFPKSRVESIIDGNSIYQFCLNLRDAPRIIAERSDNIFSILFLDVNHHIYFNSEKVNSANSLFFETCPVNLCGKCFYMDGFCFAFDFIDEEKVKTSYGYNIGVNEQDE